MGIIENLVDFKPKIMDPSPHFFLPWHFLVVDEVSKPNLVIIQIMHLCDLPFFLLDLVSTVSQKNRKV
jgi:hypothetical protein